MSGNSCKKMLHLPMYGVQNFQLSFTMLNMAPSSVGVGKLCCRSECVSIISRLWVQNGCKLCNEGPCRTLLLRPLLIVIQSQYFAPLAVIHIALPPIFLYYYIYQLCSVFSLNEEFLIISPLKGHFPSFNWSHEIFV